MQKLQERSGSGVVTIPKDYLRRDGLTDGDEIVDGQQCIVDRLGKRTYAVRFPEKGKIPELSECSTIERIAAERLMKFD